MQSVSWNHDNFNVNFLYKSENNGQEGGKLLTGGYKKIWKNYAILFVNVNKYQLNDEIFKIQLKRKL